MARNKHHRERSASKLKRKHGRRPPYPRILIVCEGRKTEPQYFEEIRIRNRIPSAHIRVVHAAHGTEPRQVVNFAESTFRAAKAYEQIYAVFDRDEHRTYHEALGRAQALNGNLRNDEKRPVTFTAIASVPCFELWLLIHFVEIHAYFERDVILRRLREHIPPYVKGMTDVFTITEFRLADATQRAGALQQRFNPFSGTDPYTNVNALVTLLRSLRPAQ